MPLIIITGLPCSGKTTRAAQIVANFEERLSSLPPPHRGSILHIPSNHARLDEHLSTGLSPSSNPTEVINTDQNLRNTIYNSAAGEKTARAEEFSAIKRAISNDVVVVADSLNYIKGYRYQLWCEAKAAGTRCCVVHVAAREDEVEGWNDGRLETWGWSEYEVGVETPGTVKKRVNGGPAVTYGELQPEGHTAVYGDRVKSGSARSASSSLDGYVDGDDVKPDRQHEDDGMTLKSLYIRDNGPDNSTAEPPVSVSNIQPTTPEAVSSAHETTSTPLPLFIPPPPTSAPPYTPTTLKSLIMRYEPPSPFSRWDTPLFTIPTADQHPPYNEIWSAIYPQPSQQLSKKARSQLASENKIADPAMVPTSSGMSATTHTTNSARGLRSTQATVAVKPHAATVLPPSTPASALQTLDSATGDVITSYLSALRTHSSIPPSGPTSSPDEDPDHNHDSDPEPDPDPSTIPFPLSDGTPCILPFPTAGTVINQPTLQRLRRRYLALQRAGIAHGRGYVGKTRAEAVEGFVRFLGEELGDHDS